MTKLIHFNYYSHIYRLAFITRYSNMIRIHDEDVAQHSFFAAAILLQLNDEYNFDLGHALQLIISHDIVEADVSDVTNDIKYKYPDLHEALSKAERSEIDKYPDIIILSYYEFERQTTIESKVAHLADVLQVIQYCTKERNLGNKPMQQIIVGARQRVANIRKEIKHVRKEN